jgi:DNA polymerase-3 subunit alpha
MKLCSLAYTKGFYYLRVDDELLAKYHNGLIALSACLEGEIPQLILEGKPKEAEQKVLFYRDLFGKDNFYLEIQDQGISAEWLNGKLSQKQVNEAVAAISRQTGIPLVAANDVHYISREDAAAHDVLLCIGQGKLHTEEKREKYYGDQFYFKTAGEMAELFPEYPEALANTVRIAERCNADVPKIEPGELYNYLPDFELPQGFNIVRELYNYLPDLKLLQGFNIANDYLRYIAKKGLAERYGEERTVGGASWENIQKRLEYELDVITGKGFANYFLLVADFINWAKYNNIPVGPGRGSAAGSITAYALGITGIDPFKYGLLFELFIWRSQYGLIPRSLLRLKIAV